MRFSLTLPIIHRIIFCLLALALANSQEIHAESSNRSFIFLWPGQTPTNAYLNHSDPITTDRPSFTDSSRTVGRGVTQFELGYTATYDGSTKPHTNSHTYPELALRQGFLANWLELRLSQTITKIDSVGARYSGLKDLELGTKIGLAPQHGVLPEISIIPRTKLPTGSSRTRSHHALPGVTLAFSWSVFSESFINGSSNYFKREDRNQTLLSSTTNEDQRYHTWVQSLGFGTKIAKELTWYIEWFTDIPRASNQGETKHYSNTGLLYLVSNDIQIDLRFGTCLGAAFGEDIFTGAGLAWRH